MTDQPWKPDARKRWTAEREEAVEQIAIAAQRVRDSDTSASRDQLGKAVDAAREAGVGWTRIGDTLGIPSGLAYHRYRTRPSKPDGRSTRATGYEPEHRCDGGEPSG